MLKFLVGVFRVITTVGVMLGAWFLGHIMDVQTETLQRVQAIEVTLAGKYMTRTEVEALVDASEARLNRRIDREHPFSQPLPRK